MPYTPTTSDPIFDKLCELVADAMYDAMTPEEFFTLVENAWQENIEQLKRDLGKAYKRMYLKYEDKARSARRAEEAGEEPEPKPQPIMPIKITMPSIAVTDYREQPLVKLDTSAMNKPAPFRGWTDVDPGADPGK